MDLVCAFIDLIFDVDLQCIAFLNMINWWTDQNTRSLIMIFN